MSDIKIEADAWVEKTRVLGCNTVIWNRWRETVTDLATPATDLEAAAASVLPTVFKEKGGDCVLEAIAMHPNAPPHLLAQIIERWDAAACAFCENPVAPFLILENPDFLVQLRENAQLALLREANCPTILVRLLASGEGAKSEAVQTAARLHIAVAGEASETGEWENQLRDYFKNRCAEEAKTNYAQEHNTDLVEMGLAPAWANGPTVPSEPAPIIRHEEADEEALREWFRSTPAPDTAEEKALMERIVPRMRKRDPLLAKGLLVSGLRAGATPDDLMALFQAADGRGIILRAVLCHPAVTPDLIRVLANEWDFSLLQGIATHPKTPPDVILLLLQGRFPIYPLIRRLARRHPNAPLNVGRVSRDIFLSTLEFGRIEKAEFPPMFTSFVICLQRANEAQGGSKGLQSDLPRRAEHLEWTTRLEAALLARNTDTAFEEDEAKRTGRDLLNHLARDGNRIVRAAAQTRLADPNYKFIL